MIDWETYNYNEKENIERKGEESATAAYKHGHISAQGRKRPWMYGLVKASTETRLDQGSEGGIPLSEG